ncbi:MAG TPA: F0F1 ATP synthase subunit gamma [Caulobacteraceae bacterium]|jgi:F-type H+-transporting ATPase subunit gamma
MPSLKEMRNRIGSVKATQKITKAMQMVAAAKLRRAQDAAENARPYAERMAAVIANLAAGVTGPGAPKLLVGTGSDRRELVIVATADRGLAGGFNSSIVRAAREHIAASIRGGRQVSVLTVGRKSRDQLRRFYGDRFLANLEAGPSPSLERAQEVADLVLARFEAGEIDVATLFFSRFRSVVSQTPTARQLIPAQVEGAGGPAQGGIDLKGACYEYEPDEETILATLLPRNVTVQIFAALLENQAGFFASQMAAMDNATRNAGDMIARFTLQYNRARQAQVTKELIEIISGAEAL